MLLRLPGVNYIGGRRSNGRQPIKRACGSKSDAYRVFQSMLANGHPHTNWDELQRESVHATEPLQQVTGRLHADEVSRWLAQGLSRLRSS